MWEKRGGRDWAEGGFRRKKGKINPSKGHEKVGKKDQKKKTKKNKKKGVR